MYPFPNNSFVLTNDAPHFSSTIFFNEKRVTDSEISWKDSLEGLVVLLFSDLVNECVQSYSVLGHTDA